MNAVNHQVRLGARPFGLPVPSDWELTRSRSRGIRGRENSGKLILTVP